MDEVTKFDQNGKPIAGRYSWEKNGSPEFTDEQLNEINVVQYHANEFLKSLAETDDDICWDLDDIWGLVYLGCKLLDKRGRKVRLPILMLKEALRLIYGENPDYNDKK